MNKRARFFVCGLVSAFNLHIHCPVVLSSGLSGIEQPQFDQNATGSSSSSTTAGGSKAGAAGSGKGKPASTGSANGKGRIAQLLSENGAQLPIKLQALTPKLDTASSKPVLLTGGVSKSGSFPRDWHGSWSGTLTIKAFQYNPQCARFDPAEFSQTQNLMQPGTIGKVTFKFSEGSDRKMELLPAQVYFSRPATINHYRFFESSDIAREQQSADSPGAGWVKIGQIRPIAGQPFTYILHLGLFEPGTGVTGNSLSGRLLSDTVKALSEDVVEQQVFTYESDVSRLTGSVGHAFSENDIQFSAEDTESLKVQAASVRYGPAGEFVDKVILEGEVRRDESQADRPPSTEFAF